MLDVEPLPGAPEWLDVYTASERPDLWQQARSDALFNDVWPEYNLHGNDTPVYFGALVPRFADFQTLFVDRRSSAIVARGRAIPFRWAGSLEDLPLGIDALGLRAVGEDAPTTALCALAAEVALDVQRSGVSSLLIVAMAAVARAHGLSRLVAPVRPSHKDRYPITPIERYATWKRPDGLPFDPWMRVHARLGARIMRPEPRSLHIVAPVADWEAWTGMSFPDDGAYVFPQGLAPLTVTDAMGEYWEPNVWMVHDVPPSASGVSTAATLTS